MFWNLAIIIFLLGEGGATKSQLVNWYLKEVEADIETVEELATKKILVEKIVERLLDHVSGWLSVCQIVSDCIVHHCRTVCWCHWLALRALRGTKMTLTWSSTQTISSKLNKKIINVNNNYPPLSGCKVHASLSPCLLQRSEKCLSVAVQRQHFFSVSSMLALAY